MYLFAGGSMPNLVAGRGDRLNAFDVTLTLIIAGIGHIVGQARRNRPVSASCRGGSPGAECNVW